MNLNLRRCDQRRGLAWPAAVFLAFELVVRTKLGTIFLLAAIWSLVHQELGDRLQGAKSGWTGEKVLTAFYHGFAIAAVIFAVFAGLNIVFRSINNSWTYFQLP